MLCFLFFSMIDCSAPPRMDVLTHLCGCPVEMISFSERGVASAGPLPEPGGCLLASKVVACKDNNFVADQSLAASSSQRTPPELWCLWHLLNDLISVSYPSIGLPPSLVVKLRVLGHHLSFVLDASSCFVHPLYTRWF